MPGVECAALTTMPQSVRSAIGGRPERHSSTGLNSGLVHPAQCRASAPVAHSQLALSPLAPTLLIIPPESRHYEPRGLPVLVRRVVHPTLHCAWVIVGQRLGFRSLP